MRANMSRFTRRDFLVYGSATMYGLGHLSHVEAAEKLSLPSSTMEMAGVEGDTWKQYGRLGMKHLGDAIVVQDGFLVSKQSWADTEFSFRARAPEGTDQVQIWGGIRCRDRDSRYIFGLRGGDNDDVYLARYAPEGGDRFLGIAPLHFDPEPGAWHTLRVVMRGNRIHIYVNGGEIPYINVEDTEPLWGAGGVSLGGGWLPVEFRDLKVASLSAKNAAAFDEMGDRVYSPPEPDRIQKRARQRATYKGITVGPIHAPRTEWSLDGEWLFLPEQDLQAGVSPQANDCDDRLWHVMDVPDFWTPTLTWLHHEIGFPQLKGISATKGISDKLYEHEISRLDGYTFPWRETKSAWYRQYVNLPLDIAGKHFELCFDAIARVSVVWVNGEKIGTHIGMFGELRCDATRAMKPGNNVIAVHVRGRLDPSRGSENIVGVAVTVEVTNSMLHSLPHGMYPENASGIWQPVTLIVTQAVAVKEVFIKPRLDGMGFSIKVGNASTGAQLVSVAYSIHSVKDGTSLYTSPQNTPKSIAPLGADLHFSTPVLNPKLWSPQDPYLYQLEILLSVGGEVQDRHITPFGFRTFEVEGEKLLLNGKPFWLRGANHFPHALRPNDDKLARRFMQMARESNVSVTRSHTAPFTKTWLDAADEVGMGVSYEGTWPWLMLEGDLPSEDLLQAWKEEFSSLLRKYRNRPSILFWTVNNEMKFESIDRKNPKLLQKKWAVLNGMMKTMRLIDPTRPIVCDSSYCRQEVADEYRDFIQPNGLDDGDIDDAHRYFGWYNPSFFHLFKGEFGDKLSWPGRPLISQEMASGYPRNDDGHPVRFYLFKHYTPQSMVGGEAYENRDPSIFLNRQAFMTKELAETIRRTNRANCSGILHFAYVSWFKDVWNVDTIQPFVTCDALAKALQPVLVSAELYGRHLYAGRFLKIRVCVANDSNDPLELPPGKLIWEIQSDGEKLASAVVSVPSVAHYSNHWLGLSIPIPAALPKSRVEASLVFRFEAGGTMRSENDYEVTIATESWAKATLLRENSSLVLDPYSEAPKLLDTLGLRTIASFDLLAGSQSLIIAGADRVLAETDAAKRLHEFVAGGGKVLLLNAGGRLAELYPAQINAYRDNEGENVWMGIPESPVFTGIAALDLCWFDQGQGNLPRACRGVYRVPHGRDDVTALAYVVDRHGYLKKTEDLMQISGSPLLELRIGRGSIVASEMMLSAEDPIAGRLLTNLIQFLA
jgi:beta-galactosidase